MRRLVLHAGLPKTGSTSIQRFLDANRKPLAQQGIAYRPTPDRRGRRDNNTLAMLFWNSVQRIYRDRFADDVEAMHADSRARWDDLLAEFRASDHQTLLVSGEFFTRASVKSFHEFADAELRDFDITPVFYLRRPSAHYVSWLQQHIKGSNQILPFGRNRARWARRFRFWQRVGDIELRELHRDVLVGGDVVTDFGAVLGADVAAMERTADANESISAAGMELLLEHRRATFPKAPDRILRETVQLIDVIRTIESRPDVEPFAKPRLRPELATYLDSDQYELHQLDRRFGFRYHDLGAPSSIEVVKTSDALEGRRFRRLDELIEIDPGQRERMRRLVVDEGVSIPPLRPTDGD